MGRTLVKQGVVEGICILLRIRGMSVDREEIEIPSRDDEDGGAPLEMIVVSIRRITGFENIHGDKH